MPITGTALRETLAARGVIASMAFVGMQIRDSNVQARAAAYLAHRPRGVRSSRSAAPQEARLRDTSGA